MKLPHRKSTIISVLSFVAGAGSMFGYTVIEQDYSYNNLYDFQSVQVTRVIDGDTIALADGQRVRLYGINAPESGSCMAEEARDYLSSLVLNRSVRLEKDLTATDQYGRLLRYVFLDQADPHRDNQLVNALVVRAGLALDESYSADIRYRDYLVQAREEAKRYHRGIWANCPEFTAEQEGSRTVADSAPEDPSCLIKGNISLHGKGRTYLLPGCGNYSQTKVSPNTGEQYFCSRAEAEQAGFTLSESCRNNGIE